MKRSNYLSASNAKKNLHKTLEIIICNVQSFPSKAKGSSFQFRVPMGRLYSYVAPASCMSTHCGHLSRTSKHLEAIPDQ